MDIRLGVEVVAVLDDPPLTAPPLDDDDLCLAPSRRVNEANGEKRLAVEPDRDGRRLSLTGL